MKTACDRVWRALIAAAVALVLVSCAAQQPARKAPSREWLSVTAASVDRRGFDSAEVDDAMAFGLEGGYDFVTTPRFNAGVELGLVWSRHSVPPVNGPEDDPRLTVARWCLGARATLDLRPVNALLYVHGGGYARDESSDDEPQFAQDGRGNYIGAGIDFWFDNVGRIGPFVRSYDFTDSDLTEVLVGVSSTFRL